MRVDRGSADRRWLGDEGVERTDGGQGGVEQPWPRWDGSRWDALGGGPGSNGTCECNSEPEPGRHDLFVGEAPIGQCQCDMYNASRVLEC